MTSGKKRKQKVKVNLAEFLNSPKLVEYGFVTVNFEYKRGKIIKVHIGKYQPLWKKNAKGWKRP